MMMLEYVFSLYFPAVMLLEMWNWTSLTMKKWSINPGLRSVRSFPYYIVPEHLSLCLCLCLPLSLSLSLSPCGVVVLSCRCVVSCVLVCSGVLWCVCVCVCVVVVLWRCGVSIQNPCVSIQNVPVCTFKTLPCAPARFLQAFALSDKAVQLQLS